MYSAVLKKALYTCKGVNQGASSERRKIWGGVFLIPHTVAIIAMCTSPPKK